MKKQPFFLILIFIFFFSLSPAVFASSPNVFYSWDWQEINENTCDSTYCDATQFSIALLKRINSEGSSFSFEANLMRDGFSDDFQRDFDYYYNNASFFETPDFYTTGLSNYFSDPSKFRFSLEGEEFSNGLTLGPGRYLIDIEIPDGFGSGSGTISVNFELLELPLEDSIFYLLPFDGEIGLQGDSIDRIGYGLGYSGETQSLAINDSVKFGNLQLEGIAEIESISIIDDFAELNDFTKRGELLRVNGSDTKFSLEFASSIPTPLILEIEKKLEEPQSFSVIYELIDNDAPVIVNRDYLLTWNSNSEVCTDFYGELPLLELYDGVYDWKVDLDEVPEGHAESSFALDWNDAPNKGKVFLETVVYRSDVDNRTWLDLFEPDEEQQVNVNFHSVHESGDIVFLSGTGNNAVDNKVKNLSSIFALVDEGYAEITVDYMGTAIVWNEEKLKEDFLFPEIDPESGCIEFEGDSDPDSDVIVPSDDDQWVEYYLMTLDGELIPSANTYSFSPGINENIIDFEVVKGEVVDSGDWSARETYNEGEVIAGLVGAGSLAGESVSVKLVKIESLDEEELDLIIYTATFQLYDGSNVPVGDAVTVLREENLADVFIDSDGMRTLDTSVVVVSIAVGVTTGLGYVEIIKSDSDDSGVSGNVVGAVALSSEGKIISIGEVEGEFDFEDDDSGGIFQPIIDFFRGIINFFRRLFGITTEAEQETTSDIIDIELTNNGSMLYALHSSGKITVFGGGPNFGDAPEPNPSDELVDLELVFESGRVIGYIVLYKSGNISVIGAIPEKSANLTFGSAVDLELNNSNYYVLFSNGKITRNSMFFDEVSFTGSVTDLEFINNNGYVLDSRGNIIGFDSAREIPNQDHHIFSSNNLGDLEFTKAQVFGATGAIVGTITDSISGDYITNAIVSTNPGNNDTLSGLFGDYLFARISIGQYTVTVRAEGYQEYSTTVNVLADELTEADIQLIPVERANIKNPEKYSEKEVFLTSDNDWRDVLSLVPVTTWMNQENVVEKYPSLVFHEENYEDRVLTLNDQMFLDNASVGINYLLKPIFNEKPNSKSFDYSFDISEDVYTEFNDGDYLKLLIKINTETGGSDQVNLFMDKFNSNLSLNGSQVRLGWSWYTNEITAEVYLWLSDPNYSLSLNGNSLKLNEFDEDYIIKEIKLYPPNYYLLSIDGELSSLDAIHGNKCDEPYYEFCITGVEFSPSVVYPQDEFTYTLILENKTDRVIDLSDNFDYKLYWSRPMTAFEYLDESVLIGEVAPGQTTSVTFRVKFDVYEEQSFDSDSILYFLKQYSAQKLTIIGETPSELDNLLIASHGGAMANENIQRINSSDYFSYWSSFNDVVAVEYDNYEDSLMASTYASYLNAPIIFLNENNVGNYENIIKEKNVITIGSFPQSIMNYLDVNTRTIEEYSQEELLQKYAALTGSKKIILVNPDDLSSARFSSLEPDSQENGVFKLFGKTSLFSPLLASAKQELIIPVHSTDYESVDEELTSKIDELLIMPETYSCETGQQCASGFVETITKKYDAGNEFSFLFEPNPEPELNVYLKAPTQNLVVGEETSLQIRIFNNSLKPAKNVPVDLYIVEEIDEQIVETTLFSTVIDELDVVFEMNYSWVPETTGDKKLKLVADYLDADQTDNTYVRIIKVTGNAPDLQVRFDRYQYRYVAGQESIIPVQVSNLGPAPAENVLVSLYLVENINGEAFETLLDSVTAESISEYGSRGDNYTLNYVFWHEFSWTPQEIGYFDLKLKVEHPDDWDQSNNEERRFIRVIQEGPDLRVLNSWDWSNKPLAGEEISIPVKIMNVGTSKAEGISASFYLVEYVNGTAFETLIDSMSVADIDSEEEVELSFNWVSEESGYFDFRIVATANEDVYPENNLAQIYVHIYDDGPDLSGYLKWDYDEIATINQEVLLPFIINNRGSRAAANSVVEIYEVESYASGENDGVLIHTETIENLEADDLYNLDVYWTPEKLEYNYFKIVVISEEDYDQENNSQTYSVFVGSDGLDLKIDYINFYGVPILNQESEIGVTIKNIGNVDAENILVEFFVNDKLLDSKTIESLPEKDRNYLYFNWTPGDLGDVELKVIVNVDEDVVPENNEYIINTVVSNELAISFEVDSADGFERTIGFSYNGYLLSGPHVVSSQTPMTINVIDTESDIFVAYIEGEISTLDKAAYSVFMGSNLNDEMKITSNYFEREVDLEDKVLHAVYANAPDWDYLNQSIYFIINDIQDISVQSIDNLTIYSCSEWDLTNEECIVDWVELDNITNNSSSKRIYLYGDAVAEAFALGESKTLVASNNKSIAGFYEGDGFIESIRKSNELLAASGESKKSSYDTYYSIVFRGILLDCEDESETVEFYSNSNLISSEIVDCYNSEEIMLSDSYSWIRSEKIYSDLSPGVITIKSNSNIYLEEEINFSVRSNYESNEAHSSFDLFYCRSVHDYCAPETTLVEMPEFLASQDSKITFSDVDTSKDYYFVVNIAGRDIEDLNFFVEKTQIGHARWANGKLLAFKIPEELVSDEIVVDILVNSYTNDDGSNNEFTYKFSNAMLIPVLDDHYLTVMASPDSIQIAKDLPQTGFHQFREEMDNRVYGSYYGKIADFATGRIFGFTSSDISAYIARSVFFEDLEKEKDALIIGREAPNRFGNMTEGIYLEQFVMEDYWTDEINEQFDSSYFCWGNEGCDQDPSVKQLYSESDLVFYLDHGSSSGFVNEAMTSDYLIENKIQLKPVTVIDIACSTCEYAYNKTERLFCAQHLRRGSMAYQGAVSVSYWENYFDILLDRMYLDGSSIGEAFKEAKNDEYDRDLYYLIIGDPTFKPKWWSE